MQYRAIDDSTALPACFIIIGRVFDNEAYVVGNGLVTYATCFAFIMKRFLYIYAVEDALVIF